MGFADTIKAVWNDPKKRPIVLAGGGVAAGAGLLALRRPTDPEEQVAEETIASEAGADNGYGYPADTSGMLPPVLYSPAPSGLNPGDSGLWETDFTMFYEELDQRVAEVQGEFGAAIDQEQTRRKRQVRGLTSKVAKQKEGQQELRKDLRKTRQQLKRLRRRVGNGPKGKSKPRGGSKAKRRRVRRRVA
jgi:hypothetical protein